MGFHKQTVGRDKGRVTEPDRRSAPLQPTVCSVPTCMIPCSAGDDPNEVQSEKSFANLVHVSREWCAIQRVQDGERKADEREMMRPRQDSADETRLMRIIKSC